jgi:hypothetical protein
MTIKYLLGFIGVGAVTFLYGRSGGDYGYSPFAIWVIGYLGAYVASLYLHPRRNCWHCKGSGRHQGMIFSHGRRPCEHCAPNSGWELRWGARQLDIHPDGIFRRNR